MKTDILHSTNPSALFRAISTCHSLEQLNEYAITYADNWKLASVVFDRYNELVKQGASITDFGTPQFWGTVLGDDFFDTELDLFADDNGVSDEDLLNVPLDVEDIGIDEWLAAYNTLTDDIVEVKDMQRGGELDLEHYCNIETLYERTSKAFRTIRTAYNVQFRNMHENSQPVELMEKLLTLLLQWGFGGDSTAEDRVGMTITHPELDHPIVIPFLPRDKLTAQHIIRRILRVMQSRKQFALDGSLGIMVVRIRGAVPGTGRRDEKKKLRINHGLWKDANSKGAGGRGGAFILIKNDDELCCARALVTSKAWVDKDPNFEAISRGETQRRTMQKRLATELMHQAGLGAHQGGCGKAELVALQAALSPDYQIKVWSKDLYNAIFFEGPKADKRLCLYLSGAHYDVIRSMPAFFDSAYYCHGCEKAYSRPGEHRCGATCVGCGKEGKCEGDEVVYCKDCNRRFANQVCYDSHKLIRQTTLETGVVVESSTCTRKKRCTKCFATYFARTKHLCGFSYCSRCKQQVQKEGHLCHMTPLERKKKRKQQKQKDEESDNDSESDVDSDEAVESKAKGWIFFDFETKQEKVTKETEYGEVCEHEVNMCVVQKVCSGCVGAEFRENSCVNCGQKVFSGTETLSDFCTWLFSPQNNGCIAFAHNAKGFDSQFILQYIHGQALKPEVIANGLKLLSLTVGGLRIIDSFSFLPMALAEFPKAFGLMELRKGYFPHFFNRTENWDYVGVLPDQKYYSPNTMKPTQRAAFMTWYNNNKEKQFHFREELEAYCISDVDILRRSCLKFRESFMAVTTVDPFDTSCTIASACMKVYRTRFLPYNAIGLIPTGGYRVKDRHSAIAVKWLMWKSQQEGIRIQHALNGGEQKVGSYKVDGLYENRVFEFNGCAFHGCPKCFPNREKILPIVNTTAEDLYNRTVDRKEDIEKRGFVVEEMWECQLRREMVVTQGMEEFFANVDIPEPLNPRDCFFGGRTNATKLYHKCSADERIDYVDVCSLYPWVCKYGVFPMGHPECIVDNFKPISATQHPYCGPIKCTVLPPRGLLHPVLPARVDGKLFFPLCRTCADTRQKVRCEHTDEERALSGTWISLELYKALEMGYEIVKVDEVWHYTSTKQFDGKNEHSSLFAGYINTFLKLKTEASGWPTWCVTEKDKLTFIRNFEEREGILLDPSNIAKNEAFRSLAKLMLNSFWGKFGQRPNLLQTAYFTEPEQYFELVFDPSNEIHTVNFISDILVQVTYTNSNDYVTGSDTANPIIASFVTAQARLKLYTYLEELQERCLYFDTDSVIYLTRKGDEYQPPIGSFLGELTNELEEYDSKSGESYITEFASTGPKSYGYEVFTPSTAKRNFMVKMKGFTLTHIVSQLLNFATIRSMVQAYVRFGQKEKTIVQMLALQRTKDRTIETKIVEKTFQLTYEKRIVLADYYTVPFGM